jgi:hypothetical protein
MSDLESTIDAAMGSTRGAMTALRRRRREFTDYLSMQLTAIEMVPEARRAFDEGLEFDEFELEMSTARVPQNRVALFRLGAPTAALATRLP